jgi:hypothetical protein
MSAVESSCRLRPPDRALTASHLEARHQLQIAWHDFLVAAGYHNPTLRLGPEGRQSSERAPYHIQYKSLFNK